MADEATPSSTPGAGHKEEEERRTASQGRLMWHVHVTLLQARRVGDADIWHRQGDTCRPGDAWGQGKNAPACLPGLVWNFGELPG